MRTTFNGSQKTPLREEVEATVRDVIEHSSHSTYCARPLLVEDYEEQAEMLVVSQNCTVRPLGSMPSVDEVEICYGVVCSLPKANILNYIDVRLTNPEHIYLKFDMMRPEARLVAAYHSGRSGQVSMEMNASRSFGSEEKKNAKHLDRLVRLIRRGFTDSSPSSSLSVPV